MKSSINFSKCKKSIFLIFIISSLSITAISFPNALAIFPVWPGAFSLNDGGVQDSFFATSAVTVDVTDIAASGAGTIQVRITSSVDPVGFDLTLNEGPLGTFTNTNLALMSDNGLAMTTNSLTISIFDDSAADPFSVQTLPPPPIFIVSDSDTTGITPTFTETDFDTNLFTATINFDTITNEATNTLAAISGDIYTVVDISGGNHANGFLNPNPNVGKGAILAEVGGTITATYQGDSSSFTVGNNPGGGRGSGGLIKPGLVVDSPSGGSNGNGGSDGSGGGCTNCTPPTLGLDSNFNRIVQQGFSFNDNAVDVEPYYTPYPLITSYVGQENTIVLKIFDDGGTQNIEHVGLAFGLGEGQSFSESKAIINLDRTLDGREKISTFDPENVLDDVEIITLKDSCNNHSNTQCLKVTISHTFRDVLEFNMVSTNVWDSKKNSWQNFYNHGVEITGDSLNPPKTKMVAFGEKNMRGLFELTELDKKKHLWIDEFANMYEYKGNDFFDRTFTAQNKVEFDKKTSHGCDRTCNWFNYYKLKEALLAEKTLDAMLDGKIIQGEPIKEAFSHSYQTISRAEDLELQKSIIFEKNKAEKLLEKLLNP